MPTGRLRKDIAIRRDYPVLNTRLEPDLKATPDALAELDGVSSRELLRVLVDGHLELVDKRTRRAVRRRVRERLR